MKEPAPLLFLKIAVFLAYMGIAWGVGNLYPFSVFDMYSFDKADSASHLLVRDSLGVAHEVFDYTAFCYDKQLTVGLASCGPPGSFYSLPRKDLEVLRYVQRHRSRSAQGRPATLVRRIWRLEDKPGPPDYHDCDLLPIRVVTP